VWCFVKTVLIEHNRYFDSVFLMRISSELESLNGVDHAVVAMGTPLNVEGLTAAGFDVPRDVRPADLILAIDADNDALRTAQDKVRVLLAGKDDVASVDAAPRPTSLAEAVEVDADINLAVISVPGRYAAREARRALQRGLHVMLFSDNVSVDDEIALKDDAVARGLLMMGPDCGTAILQGAPLGFANACRSGRIGIVGASGTGIQEISSLIDQWGGGISQAIGTGGRDLSEAVAGRMTRFAIAALGDDPGTDVIVVVSKAPSPRIANEVVEALTAAGRPAVIHFIGGRAEEFSEIVESTATLASAAAAALRKVGIEFESGPAFQAPQRDIAGSVLGLFCGGTLCQECWSLLTQAGLEVRSNVASDSNRKVHPGDSVFGHVLWDLGDDAFTIGKPHPMIEPSLRDDRVARAGADPDVGVVIADCVIGYGAHVDPGGSLAHAAREATQQAEADGRTLTVLASVTGTDADPQRLSQQRAILRDAGVLVGPSNAAVAHAAATLLTRGAS
jgi:FdrA protein